MCVDVNPLEWEVSVVSHDSNLLIVRVWYTIGYVVCVRNTKHKSNYLNRLEKQTKKDEV